jgi:alpha-glucosidase
MAFEIIPASPSDSSTGQITYSVSFLGKPLITASSLRLNLADQPPLGANVRIVNTTTSEMDEFYHLTTGKVSAVRNHAKTLTVELEEGVEPHRRLTLEARAYDDAIAFRYIVPEQAALKSFELAGESTEFCICKDPTLYALMLPHFRSMYESEYVKLQASSLGNQGGVGSTALIGLPLLMDVPGVGWLAIAEADMPGYAAMYLTNPSGGWANHALVSKIAPQVGNTNLCVTGSLPHQSPWRVLLVGTTPGALIESTVLTSLNPPSEIKDTSWIQAGKASWDWWNGSIGPDGKSAYTTDTMKSHVDFASKSGFQYMLVDAGWSTSDITKTNGTVDIPELVKYASIRAVRVWIWIGYGPTCKQMDEAFALYESWGVAGVKIDFIERDDQDGIAFYYTAARKAAEHHLMVDFHGCTKPSGLDRTFPNVMGYEAVLGMEQSKGGARDNPDSHTMLPFTRMLVGRMDYTPGAFNNVTREQFEPRDIKPMVMGTRAHQLAMYVVFESPFQMVSDYPAAFEGQPGFDFIKDVPVTWDEIHVLQGEPGQCIALARRHGEDWYLGVLNNWQPRDLELPLDFLGTGHYRATIFADASDSDKAPQHLSIDKKRARASTRLKIQLAPGGGAAIQFKADK